MLYLSVDVANVNIASRESSIYESRWQTYLMAADDPWKGGFTIRCDMNYDGGEGNTAIDMVNGM